MRRPARMLERSYGAYQLRLGGFYEYYFCSSHWSASAALPLIGSLLYLYYSFCNSASVRGQEVPGPPYLDIGTSPQRHTLLVSLEGDKSYDAYQQRGG